MKNKEQWVCQYKDFELPLIVDSKEKAIEWLTNCNNSRCDGEGIISEEIEYNHSFTDEETQVTKIILTVGSYDEEDPIGIAYQYDYGEALWNSSIGNTPNNNESTEGKITHCFNPLFGDNQPYDKIFYSLQTREINGKLSIAVIKEASTKSIKIKSQKDVCKWLYDNIDIEQRTFSEIKIDDSCINPNINNTIPVVINSVCSNISVATRRRPGNKIIVGKNIFNEIKGMLVQRNELDRNISDDYVFHGYLNQFIAVYTPKDNDIVKDNDVIVSSSTGAIENGIFLLRDKDTYYLNTIPQYKDYVKIIELSKK